MTKYEKIYIRNTEAAQDFIKALDGLKGLSDSQHKIVEHLKECIRNIPLIEDLHHLESVKTAVLNDIASMGQEVKGRYFSQYANKIEDCLHNIGIGKGRKISKQSVKSNSQITLERIERKLGAGDYKAQGGIELQKQIIELAFKAGAITDKKLTFEMEIAELEMALISGLNADIKKAIKDLNTAVSDMKMSSISLPYSGIALMDKSKELLLKKNNGIFEETTRIQANIAQLKDEARDLDRVKDILRINLIASEINAKKGEIINLCNEETQNSMIIQTYNLIKGFAKRLLPSHDAELKIRLSAKLMQGILVNMDELQNLVDELAKIINKRNEQTIELPNQKLIVSTIQSEMQAAPTLTDGAKQLLDELAQEDEQSIEKLFSTDPIKLD